MSSFFLTYGSNRLNFPGVTGAVGWNDVGVLFMLDPNRESNPDYMKMRFITPGGDEIVLEDGDGNTASASAYVPTNSTAYWTAHGYEGGTAAKYFVSAFGCAGFSGVSSDTAVTTGVIDTPYSTAYGSGILTAYKTASAGARTWASWLVTYGQGSTAYPVSLSASSFIGNYSTPFESAEHSAWLPNGSRVKWSASADAGMTFSMSADATGLSGFGIDWDHTDSGTKMDVSGYVVSDTPLKIGDGRSKNVYATGQNPTLPASALKSAAAWQPQPIITAFSSNLCSGSAADGYMEGTGNVSAVHGFSTANGVLGQWKNSAGSWATQTTSTKTCKWANRYFLTNSAEASATFSAIRHAGPTGNNNAIYAFYGRGSGGNSVVRQSAQFAVPTASGNTSTLTKSYASSVTDSAVEIFTVISNQVSQSTAVCCNCSGVWTASGVVI